MPRMIVRAISSITGTERRHGRSALEQFFGARTFRQKPADIEQASAGQRARAQRMWSPWCLQQLS